MVRKACLFLLALAALPSLADTSPVEIPLDHLTLRWSLDHGLVVTCDGRSMFEGTLSPVVAYPPGWAWSQSAWGADRMSVALETRGETQVLTITCTDPKIIWTETVTAGPGDRFTIAYAFTQNAWDQAMNYETCICRPSTGWFVGARWRASGPGGSADGQIPLAFGGVSNPFGGMLRMEFENLFGKLTIAASKGLTLFDYAHRQSLWLGRDDAFPRGVEQNLSAEFTFEPSPLEVGGVRISELNAPDRAIGEKLTVSMTLARLEGGPETVTARLVLDGVEPAVTDEQAVSLVGGTAGANLSVALPGPGRYASHLELMSAGQAIYVSPPLPVEVPRLLTITPGRLPYLTGEQGAIVVRVAEEAGDGLRIAIQGPGGALAEGPVVAGKPTSLPIALDALSVGRNAITGVLSRGDEKLGSASCDMLIADPQPNAVIIDNATHTLIVGGLPFCPQSFYTDYGIAASVASHEAPLGFNTVAPYLPGGIAERRKERDNLRQMMDRCAEVGVMVQLDIRGASRPPQDQEKWQWLEEEIAAFKDHPALLAYYLADEPELGWATPEECEAAYRRIKELDPCHPVTMVFCQSQAAARYAKGMDIIMTDPYPIPHAPVTNVVDFCRQIRSDTQDALPLWIVPQAFGGGEWWRREPSRQEERVMTYLALIHGCKGVQPFIRRPPVSNPNNPDLWSEVRRLMLELSQLVPALASPEEAPNVTCGTPQVHVAAFRERGAMTLLCANVENKPLVLDLALEGVGDGEAEVLFENRKVLVSAGKWSDMIDGLGTRAYRIQVDAPPPDLAALDPGNLIINPSFEEAHNVGTPDGSYISSNDPAASWFVDPRTAVHGRQSLRLCMPAEDRGISVAPFPLTLAKDQKYRLSIWARGDRDGQRFRLALDAVQGAQAEHELTTQWREYSVEFIADPGGRKSPALRLLSPGQAWFDALQVVEMD